MTAATPRIRLGFFPRLRFVSLFVPSFFALTFPVLGLTIEGVLVPKASETYFAPTASIRIRGWWMERMHAKATFLVEEGTKVEAGTLLARFETDFDQLRDYVVREHSRAEAERDLILERIRQDQADHGLLLARKRLRAEQLAWDLRKRDLVAEKDFAIMEMEAKIADFEVEAERRVLELLQRHYRNAEEYHRINVVLAGSYLTYLDTITASFEHHATKAGLVTYPLLAHRRRKIAVGQWIMGGWAYLKLATSTEVLVEAHLPEHLYPRLTQGQEVLVGVARQGGRFRAKITEINGFPVELGTLEDDFSTPYATEKVFLVRAEPLEPAPYAPGSEVEVELPDPSPRGEK